MGALNLFLAKRLVITIQRNCGYSLVLKTLQDQLTTRRLAYEWLESLTQAKISKDNDHCG